jgi:hypothetical protein
MKMFYYLLCLFLFSCGGPHENTIIKEIKVEFEIKNYDDDFFGYKVIEEDEDIGVNSICIIEDNIYFTDTYHSNIKLYNIKKGTLLSSASISNLSPDKSGVWIRDICYFNDKIYVTSDRGEIFIYTKELKLEKILKCEIGAKTILSNTNDSLLIFFEENQLHNLDVSYDLIYINKNDDLKIINKTIGLNDYKTRLKNKYVIGKEYYLFNEDQDEYLFYKGEKIKLIKPLPEVREYTSRNIDVSSKYLVYFDSKPDKLTLFINQIITSVSR